MTTEQIPTSSVKCAINGHGPRETISFTTTDIDVNIDSMPEITSTSEPIFTTPDNQFHTTTERDSSNSIIVVNAVVPVLCGVVIIAAVSISLVVFMCARIKSRRKLRVCIIEMQLEQQPDDGTDKKPDPQEDEYGMKQANENKMNHIKTEESLVPPRKEANEEPDDTVSLKKVEKEPLLKQQQHQQLQPGQQVGGASKQTSQQQQQRIQPDGDGVVCDSANKVPIEVVVPGRDTSNIRKQPVGLTRCRSLPSVHASMCTDIKVTCRSLSQLNVDGSTPQFTRYNSEQRGIDADIKSGSDTSVMDSLQPDPKGKNVIPADVRQESTIVSGPHPPAQSPEQEAKKRQAMTEIALRKIKHCFSHLVFDIQSSMEERKVQVKKVRRFLLVFCEGNCSIPKDDNLDTVFDTITEARLWHYDHYGILEELAKEFLPEDDPARVQVTEYKSQLTGFQATTRIIDFVKLNELEDREEIPGRLFSPKRYNSHYQKLTVELKLERDVSEFTLLFVDELWRALMKEFHLPPLTAVIDKIVEGPGSLTITWLILPHIIDKIKATYFKSVEFFQEHNVINIYLYDNGGNDPGLKVYHEEWMTGSTPLFRASFSGNIDEVKDLLEGGANVNEANDNAWGHTSLIGASMTGQADIAKLLLEHKAIIDYQDKKYGLSALHTASGYGSTATVLVLLEYGAQVDQLDVEESTSLMLACQFGSAATARVLLEHGASVDLCDKYQWSALMLASGQGHQEIVPVLLEYRAQNDGTVLACAIAAGYANIARLLLKNGATMDFEDKIWKEFLRYASEQGFSEVVSVLLEYAAPVNLIVDEEQGNTLLCVACENGQTETAKVLLDHGATLDYQNKKGQSAVHLASVGEHTETLKVLIEKIPQLNLQDQNGWTPLHFAVNQDHLEIIELLLEHRAAADIKSNSGLTALKMAQSKGDHQDACDILLRYTQHDGSKIISPEQEVSKARQEEEVKTELAKAHQAEVKSVSKQLWEGIKRVFLRERAKKELAAQMAKEHGTSELIMPPIKQTAFLNRLYSRIGPRRGRRPVMGRAPAPEHIQ